MNIAIIEYNSHHDELFFPLYVAFEELNHNTTFFTTNINIRRNIFFNENARYRMIKYIHNYKKYNPFHYLFKILNIIYNVFYIININIFYDIVIFNSIEPLYILKYAKYIFKPKISIIHNANIINNKYFQYMYKKYRFTLLCLSDYISNYIKSYGFDCYVFYPYELPHVNKNNFQNIILKNDYLVQGNIEIKRKNYNLIFNYLKNDKSIFIHLIGNITKDIYVIKDYLKYFNIESNVILNNSLYNYKDYYNEIYKYSFILFLLNENDIEYFPYYHYKYTSSLATSISFSIIPIVDENTAEKYNIKDISITYKDSLLEAFNKIKKLTNNDIIKLKEKIFEYKKASKNKNIKLFKTLIGDNK